MNITVIGLGFVGLTTGLGLAEAGHKVIGVEQDEDKLKALNQGKVPFFEPILPDKLVHHKASFSLVSSITEAQSLHKSEVIMVCVGTPSGKNGEVDLRYVINAIEGVKHAINQDKENTTPCVICIKSTVPPSSARDTLMPLLSDYEHLHLANNPEFLREGYAWQDFIEPDRIVIGGDNKALDLLEVLYTPFSAPIHKVSLTEAEFIKYLSNTLLATLISFANEQATIAHAIGDIDIKKAFSILHEDQRWSNDSGSNQPVNMASYVYPGCGFGGYCLPKDLQALIAQAEQYYVSPGLLKQVDYINKNIVHYHADRIINNTDPTDKIAVLGLAFKPNSDDVRDTPAYKIISALLKNNRKYLQCYDPQAIASFSQHYGVPVTYKQSFEECVEDADAIVISTAWEKFKELENMLHFETIKKQNKLFDLRYLFAHQE